MFTTREPWWWLLQLNREKSRDSGIYVEYKGLSPFSGTRRGRRFLPNRASNLHDTPRSWASKNGQLGSIRTHLPPFSLLRRISCSIHTRRKDCWPDLHRRSRKRLGFYSLWFATCWIEKSVRRAINRIIVALLRNTKLIDNLRRDKKEKKKYLPVEQKSNCYHLILVLLKILEISEIDRSTNEVVK